MTIKSRRRILKGLGVALPAAWARPVVEAVVLPAHAQTSAPMTTVNCGAPEGCYLTENGSFSWPGGSGPYDEITLYGGEAQCVGMNNLSMFGAVVATSAAEAQEAMGTAVPPDEIPTDPSPSGGCSFFGLG